MKKYLFIIFALTIILSSCQNSKEVKDQLNGRIELSERPIWINQECESKTVDFRLDHLEQDLIEVKLDNEVVEVNFFERNNNVYGEIIIPTQIQHNLISISNRKENKVITKQEIIYAQKEDTISFYSNNIFLPKPIIVKKSTCWKDYIGSEIPGGFEYEINYNLKETTQRIGKTLNKTIELENVFLVEKESRKKYILSPNIIHSATVKNYGNFENTITNSNSKTKVELGHNYKNLPKTVEMSLGISTDENNYPSYRLLESIYGNQIVGVVKSCNEIDTIEIEAFILPEQIQVELSCLKNR